MHAGWRALYYPYKMLLATLRAVSRADVPTRPVATGARAAHEEDS
jgi:hypothetical protein